MEYIRKLQKSKGRHDVKKMVADADVEKCEHIATTNKEKVNKDFKYIDEGSNEVQLQAKKMLSK